MICERGAMRILYNCKQATADAMRPNVGRGIESLFHCCACPSTRRFSSSFIRWKLDLVSARYNTEKKNVMLFSSCLPNCNKLREAHSTGKKARASKQYIR